MSLTKRGTQESAQEAKLCKTIEMIETKFCTEAKELLNDKKEYLRQYVEFSKYRDETVQLMLQQMTNSCMRGSLVIHWTKSDTKAYVFEKLSKFAEVRKECKTAPLWSVPITFIRFPATTARGKMWIHALWMFVNRPNKQIELMDPNGCGQTLKLTKHAILAWFKDRKEPLATYQFITVQNTTGPQAKVGIGDCAHWTSLYAFVRLKCPFVSLQDLFAYLTSMSTERLYRLILCWFCFLQSMARKYNLKKG